MSLTGMISAFENPIKGLNSSINLEYSSVSKVKKCICPGAHTAAEIRSTPTSLALAGQSATGLAPPAPYTGQLSGVCVRVAWNLLACLLLGGVVVPLFQFDEDEMEFRISHVFNRVLLPLNKHGLPSLHLNIMSLTVCQGEEGLR